MINLINMLCVPDQQGDFAVLLRRFNESHSKGEYGVGFKFSFMGGVPLVGKTILGYTIEEVVGSGGFGTVYRASKKNLAGTYTRALKHISIPTKKQYASVLNSMGGDYEKADCYFFMLLQDIISEIKIISTLSESFSKHIVRYYENDIYETDSPKSYQIFILMEYLKPFSDYICEKPMTVKDVVRLGKEILSALKVCHEHQIIHRDIKEDNIFVDSDGIFKLGDFGVSKMLQDQSRAGSVKGTPNYIAPEVYLGKEEYDLTVDLYSLGIVLYKLLNKSRNPFLPAFPASYDSKDEEKAFERRMKYEVPPLPVDANNALGQVILKALLPAPDRYRSADDFMQALEAAGKELNDEQLNIQINTVLKENTKSFRSFHESSIPERGEDAESRDFSKSADISYGAVDREFFGSFAYIAPDHLRRDEADCPDVDEGDMDSQNDNVPVDSLNLDEGEGSPEEEATDENADEGLDSFEEDIRPQWPIKRIVSISLMVFFSVALIAVVILMIPKNVEMPSLEGLTKDEAQQALEECKLNASFQYEKSKTVHKDFVISQEIPFGSLVKKSTEVVVVISSGKVFVLPDFTGKPLVEAVNVLEKNNIKYDADTKAFSDTVDRGDVIKQTPKKGTEVSEGEEVVLVISKGIEMIPVPDFLGMTEGEVRQAMDEQLRYSVKEEYSDVVPKGEVIKQEPAPGDSVEKNTMVTITYSLGEKPTTTAPETTSSAPSSVKSTTETTADPFSVGWTVRR